MLSCQHANMPTWFHHGPWCADYIIGVWTTILCWCIDQWPVWCVDSVGEAGRGELGKMLHPNNWCTDICKNNICYFKGPTPTFCTFVVALVNYSAPTYCSCAASPSPVQATSNSCCARTYAPAHLRLRHSHLLHHIPHSHHLLSLMSDVWCLRQSMFHRVGRVNQTHNQQWEFETFLWQQNITWTKSGLGLSKFISRFRISSNFCRGVIGDNIHYLTF